jgi:general secretion pathway protein F
MQFQVKAMRQSDGIVSFAIEATDEADANRQLSEGGYSVLSIKPAMSWNVSLGKRRHRFPLVLFNQELLALLGAGLTLVEAIEGLAEKEAHGPTRAVLDHVYQRLQQGRTLSDAMQELPDAFPPLYVSTVRATERTGDLPDALARYAAYEAQVDTVRKKVVSASIYPVLLMIVGTLVVLFLLGYVVPKFSHVYEDIQGDLPLMSQWLLMAGRLLDDNAVLVGIAALVSVAVAARAVMLTSVRRWIGEQIWRIPAIGQRMHLYQLARFYRTLGMLLRGGTPVVTAIDMTSGMLAPALKPGLAKAREAIRIGHSISEAMADNGLTTPVALRMLRVGERSGRMDQMMERIASFLDEEVARWVEWFTRLFEPLLMAFIGVIIGLVVVLMYMPVFELAGSIQ